MYIFLHKNGLGAGIVDGKINSYYDKQKYWRRVFNRAGKPCKLRLYNTKGHRQMKWKSIFQPRDIKRSPRKEPWRNVQTIKWDRDSKRHLSSRNFRSQFCLWRWYKCHNGTGVIVSTVVAALAKRKLLHWRDHFNTFSQLSWCRALSSL